MRNDKLSFGSNFSQNYELMTAKAEYVQQQLVM
jgi:hypothetical protein